jgi:uncharacterized OsmC-like protein
LNAEAVGKIEKDGNVLIIRSIHVTYQLKADEEHREVIERVLGFHASHCPVARSIENSIAITTAVEMHT